MEEEERMWKVKLDVVRSDRQGRVLFYVSNCFFDVKQDFVDMESQSLSRKFNIFSINEHVPE